MVIDNRHFRQNNKSAEKLWLKKNAHQLIKFGMLPELLEDEFRWWHLLSHGFDVNGYQLRLTSYEAGQLFGVLSEFYDPKNWDFLRELERLIEEKS